MACRSDETIATQSPLTARENLDISLARLRDYAECASDWFWECARDGTLTSIQRRGGGADLGQFVGQSALELLAGAVPKRQAARLRRAVARSRAFQDVRISVLLPGIGERYFSLSGKPVFGIDATIIGYRGALSDLTAWRNRERELLAVLSQKRRLAAVVNAVGSGIIMADATLPDNPIIQVNPAFCEMTGYDEAEILGRNCRFLQGHETDPDAVAKLRRSCREAQPVRVEILNYRKDGSSFWNDLMVAPVFDESGALEVFVGVQRDISFERERREQAERTHRLESLGLLAGGIAHDFNNLLAIAQGYLQTVCHNPEQREADRAARLAAAMRALKRGTHLTRQLLTFSSGRIGDHCHFDLYGFLEEQRALLQPLVKDTVALRFVPAAGENLPVMADPELLGQVLINLVSNADHAMPHGGRLTIEGKRVRRGCLPPVVPKEAASTDYGCLSVTDSGIGIKREDLSRIFEPFATTKPKGQGSGLGLSLVYGIVTSCGGYIDVESEVGAGTSFRIWLPLIEPAARPLKGGMNAQWGQSGDSASRTLLIADDDEAMRRLLCQQASALGYRVISAANGDEALDLAGKADAVLSDVSMPELDGVTLARLLANRYPGLPVVLMSGGPETEAGAAVEGVPVLTKPVEPQRLAAMLDTAGPLARQSSEQ